MHLELPNWLLILGASGLTVIVTLSTLFASIRKYSELFRCSQCLGFWVGLGAGSLLFLRRPESLVCTIIEAFLIAGATSLVSYIAALWILQANPPDDDEG